MIFDHVQICVPLARVEETIAFWEKIIGLERVAKPNTRPGAWFRVGEHSLHLGVEEVEGNNAKSKRHVCFRVNDVDMEERRLREKGITIFPDEDPAPGWKRFYVRDPAGNRLEIGQAI